MTLLSLASRLRLPWQFGSEGLEEFVCMARVLQKHVLEKDLLSTLTEGRIDSREQE
jgi:hypothetical protein